MYECILTFPAMLKVTNFPLTKHLYNFHQPMNHMEAASPACYWLSHWEIPTFCRTGSIRLDLFEGCLYFPFCSSRVKVARPGSLIRRSRGLINTYNALIKDEMFV